MNDKDKINFYLDEVIKYTNKAFFSDNKEYIKKAQFYIEELKENLKYKEIINSNKCIFSMWKGIRISELSYEQIMDFCDYLHNEGYVELHKKLINYKTMNIKELINNLEYLEGNLYERK